MLAFLALLGAPYIYEISSLRFKYDTCVIFTDFFLVYEKEHTICNVVLRWFPSFSFRISQVGSLYITNISQEDAGIYECSAVNTNGRTRAQGQLTVKGKFIFFVSYQ